MLNIEDKIDVSILKKCFVLLTLLHWILPRDWELTRGNDHALPVYIFFGWQSKRFLELIKVAERCTNFLQADTKELDRVLTDASHVINFGYTLSSMILKGSYEAAGNGIAFPIVHNTTFLQREIVKLFDLVLEWRVIVVDIFERNNIIVAV